MIPYASRTGTKRNLAALRRADWRLLLCAGSVLRNEGFRYGLDNGAWSAHQQQRPWNERAFCVAVEKVGADADWVVVPDIVAGGEALAGTVVVVVDARARSNCSRSSCGAGRD